MNQKGTHWDYQLTFDGGIKNNVPVWIKKQFSEWTPWDNIAIATMQNILEYEFWHLLLYVLIRLGTPLYISDMREYLTLIVYNYTQSGLCMKVGIVNPNPRKNWDG